MRPRKPSGSFQIEFPSGKGPKAAIVMIGAVIVIAALIIVSTGKGGVGLVDISDKQVAVTVNYWTGKRVVRAEPGYALAIPYLERIFLFDKEPIEFEMRGDRDVSANHVRRLMVRANDGSEFWFEDVRIQYRLIPERAAEVMQDSGTGNAFKRNWVKAYARSILRDEFGKFSAEDAADPTTYVGATQTALDRLNALLVDHGLEILQIVTPRPKFQPQYEKAIEDRKLADQKVEKLKREAEQKLVERERKLEGLEREMNTEYQALLGRLEGERLAAERDAIRTQRAADAYKIREVQQGVAIRNRLVEEARGLTVQARKEAEGLAARVEALEARGEVLVREALARKFAGIRFEVVPYRRDPAPIRIEHMGGAAAVEGGKQR